ncbi:MAG: RES family NAD+ phosphorylase [Oligoflexus sp.]
MAGLPDQLKRKLEVSRFANIIYRAIYTSSPSKNLFQDIGFDEDDPDLALIKDLANDLSDIDHRRPQSHRPFQYCDIDSFLQMYLPEDVLREELLYPLRNASRSRFSHGLRGVWYGALHEDTTIAETAYHFVRQARYDLEHENVKSRTCDRRMVAVNVASPKSISLVELAGEYPALVDAHDYSLCQRLGDYALEHGIDLYLTPSARHLNGINTPIFQAGILPENTKTYRYYHFTYHRQHGLSIKRSMHEERLVEIPESWRIFAP